VDRRRQEGFERASCRRIPSLSSEAPGSPALRPFTMHECVHSTYRGAGEQVIDGPRQCRRQDGQRLARAVLGFQAHQLRLPGRMMAAEQHGRFGQGPLEVRLADRGARGPRAGARGCPGTRDEAAGGDAILPAGKAVHRMHGREHDQGQAFPHPGAGTQAVEGGASCCLAVCTLDHARSVSRASSEVSRARSTSMFFGTAASSKRSATPVRWAL